MVAYGDDIYTEPDGDPNTLANLGPLRAMAGVWEGTGTDQHPAAEGIERKNFVEHYELQPIDRLSAAEPALPHHRGNLGADLASHAS